MTAERRLPRLLVHPRSEPRYRLGQALIDDSAWATMAESRASVSKFTGRLAVRHRSSTTAAVTAVLLGVAVASPAIAAGESGTRYCTLSGYPFARGYTTGTTDIVPPGANYGLIFENGSTWTVRYLERSSPGGGGYWHVQTDGQNSDPGTYSGCAV